MGAKNNQIQLLPPEKAYLFFFNSYPEQPWINFLTSTTKKQNKIKYRPQPKDPVCTFKLVWDIYTLKQFMVCGFPDLCV